MEERERERRESRRERGNERKGGREREAGRGREAGGIWAYNPEVNKGFSCGTTQGTLTCDSICTHPIGGDALAGD